MQRHLSRGKSCSIARVDDGEITHVSLFEHCQIYEVLSQRMETDVLALGAGKPGERRFFRCGRRDLRVGGQYVSVCVASRPGCFGDRVLGELDTAHDTHGFNSRACGAADMFMGQCRGWPCQESERRNHNPEFDRARDAMQGIAPKQ